MNYTKYWAPITWTLFHSLAENVLDNKIGRKRVINIIKLVSNNLPCPECTNHSRSYLNNQTYKLNSISSKKELKLWIFNFHNNVNKQTNKPLFHINQLNKYKKYNIDDVIYLWLKYFKIFASDLKLGFKKNTLENSRNQVINLIKQNKLLFKNY